MNSYWNQELLNLETSVTNRIRGAVTEYFVIDNFFSDPLRIREKLLTLDYEEPPDPKHGVISCNAIIPDTIAREITERAAKIMNVAVSLHARSKISATYERYPLNSVCHVDGGDGMSMFNWTLVIYMNLPDQCRGGTRLFRHLESGDICNRKGWKYYSSDANNPIKWQVVDEVAMRFNRALFMPAWRFHSLSFTFGSSIQDARLTVNPKLVV